MDGTVFVADGKVFVRTRSHARTQAADGQVSDLMGKFLDVPGRMVQILAADGRFFEVS